MAEKLADVLDAAKMLCANGEFKKGDIKIKPYPHLGEKVRIFVVQPGNLPDVLVAGDALPSDTKDATKAKKILGDEKVTSVLKAVSEMASSEVKPRAQAAGRSS